MPTRPMTAWLIKWDWMGDHAAVGEPYVDIVSARRSPDYISKYVQRLYGVFHYSLTERTDFERYRDPRERPFPVVRDMTRHGLLISVGHNPHLTARKVRNLVVGLDEETGQDIVTWEPYL